MDIYLVYLHIICAFVSLGLLIIRGAMQLTKKDWRAVKSLKILPHLIDTLLVLSGIIMLFIFNYGLPVWIIAKTVLLIGYIVFSAKFLSKKQLNFINNISTDIHPITYLLAKNNCKINRTFSSWRLYY